MAEIKLFRLGSQVEELKSHSAVIEKELQNKIEKNMFELRRQSPFHVTVCIIRKERKYGDRASISSTI